MPSCQISCDEEGPVAKDILREADVVQPPTDANDDQEPSQAYINHLILIPFIIIGIIVHLLHMCRCCWKLLLLHVTL